MSERIFLGLDIGWSASRRSCGVAASGARLTLPGAVDYGSGTVAAKLRLDELTSALRNWSRDHPDELARAVIVIDGPLVPAAAGLPSSDRAVDSSCGTGGFRGRAQPMLMSHPSSKVYVRATYSVVEALGPTAPAAIWTGGPLPDGTILVETNPTVALALLLPKQPIESLPSRKRARLVDGRSVRAKSDWYWRIGAGQCIADALGCSAAAGELDHERVAALTCLALAKQLVSACVDGSTAIALGDESGIYLASARHDSSWSADLPPVGVRAGTREPVSRSAVAGGAFEQLEIATPCPKPSKPRVQPSAKCRARAKAA